MPSLRVLGLTGFEKQLKNISRPSRVFAVKGDLGAPAPHAATPKAQSPPRLSIVVLPFVNLGGGLAVDPHFTIASFRAGNRFSDSAAHLAWRERLHEDMRKAGAPEQ